MRDVAHEAGTSLSGLYHYFDRKETMLFLVQFRTFSALVTTVREKLHGITDPVERLHILVRAHVDYFTANMAALKVCSHELDSLTGSEFEEIRRQRKEYYDLVRVIVEQLCSGADSTKHWVDPHVATMSLFGTLNWLYRWYDPARDRSPSTIATQVATQFLWGVSRSGAPAKTQD
jgi:AcrR family transcriptional regulator